MTTPATPKPTPTTTALQTARQTWRQARFDGDTHRTEVARQRIDHLLDKLAATLPRQEQP